MPFVTSAKAATALSTIAPKAIVPKATESIETKVTVVEASASGVLDPVGFGITRSPIYKLQQRQLRIQEQIALLGTDPALICTIAELKKSLFDLRVDELEMVRLFYY